MTKARKARAYCSANDRMVPVLVKDEEGEPGVPSPRDAEALTCLDYGVRCTGYLCPLFSLPTLQEKELTESPYPRPSAG
ncbi:MAG TPA: hypothetical protein VLL48_11090 [Longimicrobiales bacterium]|nr:hypothetical protein [Longimicrobiales bacterium]